MIGGWLNWLLLFKISDFLQFLILTASLACLVKASLKSPVISILNEIFSSSGCSKILCLYNILFSFLFLNPARCSFPLNLAEREVSPSYTLLISFDLHISQVQRYPTLLVLQMIFVFLMPFSS